MDTRQKGNRCKAKTRDGKPCRAAATESGLCFFHSNPNKAAELGRKGGRSRLTLEPDNTDPVPQLISVKAVRDFVARLADEVYSGQTHPSVARGLAPLIQLQLRALHITDVEERIAKLEQGRAQSDDDSSTGETGEPIQ